MRDRRGSLNVPLPHRQSPYALATLPPTPRKRSTPEGVSAMVEYQAEHSLIWIREPTAASRQGLWTNRAALR
jgi:hypothetical protein